MTANTTQGGKEDGRKTSSGPSQATNPSGTRGARRRVRQPRSAAIVLTLSPEAEAKGESYARILADARSVVKVEEHGLRAVGLRVAQTGARVIEVPGSDRAEKADRIAEDLRAALSGRGVTVARPEKMADI